jgi:hypothetical protein
MRGLSGLTSGVREELGSYSCVVGRGGWGGVHLVQEADPEASVG